MPKLTAKQLLEKRLEEQLKNDNDEQQQIMANFERLNEVIKNTSDDNEGIIEDEDMDFLKEQLTSIADNSPTAQLLAFSSQNRYLLRSKKNNKRKLTPTPKVQLDLLMEQNFSNFRNEVRMGKEAFLQLHEIIKDNPAYQYKGVGRHQLPSDVQLMIALNRLGSSGSGGAYGSVARSYSISGK